MWYETNYPDCWAGIELLKQEYLVALADVKARADLTTVGRLRRRYELAAEYQRNRTQELEVMYAQICDDRAEVSKRWAAARI